MAVPTAKQVVSLMQRLFFVNRYFAPDHSATSQLLTQLAVHLAQSGRAVHVITSRQLYDDPGAELPGSEELQGVQIHRVIGSRFGRSRMASRAIDYLSFYASARQLLLKMVRPSDIVVTMTDPPLLSILGTHIRRRTGARTINWLQDIYPEIAAELGVPLVSSPLARGLRARRDLSLRSADANVVVGTCMAERLTGFGVAAELIHTAPNWCNDESIRPLPSRTNPLRKQWELGDKFVVGYSGNLGRAHEFETLLAAADKLKSDPNIVFLFIGGGHHMRALEQRVKDAGLISQFRFLPYQEEGLLPFSLSVPNLHWISLRPELDGLVVPSKVYGIAAAGRPFISVSSPSGEVARLATRFGSGIVVAPGHSAELARVIRRLAGDSQEVDAVGARARAMIDRHYARRHALGRWVSVIEKVEQMAEPDMTGLAESALAAEGTRERLHA